VSSSRENRNVFPYNVCIRRDSRSLLVPSHETHTDLARHAESRNGLRGSHNRARNTSDDILTVSAVHIARGCDFERATNRARYPAMVVMADSTEF
jgi:hypothetical protein